MGHKKELSYNENITPHILKCSTCKKEMCFGDGAMYISFIKKHKEIMTTSMILEMGVVTHEYTCDECLA